MCYGGGGVEAVLVPGAVYEDSSIRSAEALKVEALKAEAL